MQLIELELKMILTVWFNLVLVNCDTWGGHPELDRKTQWNLIDARKDNDAIIRAFHPGTRMSLAL
jgi:hypothetical protein